MPKTVTLDWDEYERLTQQRRSHGWQLIEQENRETQEANAALVAENQKLRARIKTENSTLDKHLADRNASLLAENLQLEKALDHRAKEYNKLYASYTQLRDEANDRLIGKDAPQIASLQQKLSTQEAVIAGLVGTRDSLQQQLATEKDRLDSVQRSRDNMARALLQEQTGNAALQKDRNAIAKQRDEARKELAEIKAEGYTLAYLADDALRRVRVPAAPKTVQLVQKFLAFKPADEAEDW